MKAGRLFDSKSGQIVNNQTILILGDRITDVGPADQVKIPAGAQIIDLSQATVMPPRTPTARTDTTSAAGHGQAWVVRSSKNM